MITLVTWGILTWVIPSQLHNHMEESSVMVLSLRQAPDTLPMQRSLTPDKSDITGAQARIASAADAPLNPLQQSLVPFAKVKCQILANTPELLCYANIS
jgi:hypothetical protein